MSRLLPLLVLLSGCWPRIPGSWSDYEVPEETRISGYMLLQEPMGGYWGDDSDPTGIVLWGWIGRPEPGTDPVRTFHEPGTEGCHSGPSDLTWLFDQVESIGIDQTSIVGPTGKLELEAVPDYEVFAAELVRDDVASGIYSLEPFASPLGEVSVPELLRMPVEMSFEGPELDDSTWGTVDPADLVYTWTPRESELDEQIVIAGYLVDANYELLEVQSCLAPMSAGEIALPDDWDELSSAFGVFVSLNVLHVNESRLDGEESASRMVGVQEKLGFLELE